MFDAVALGTKQAASLEQYQDYRLHAVGELLNNHKKLNHKLEEDIFTHAMAKSAVFLE